MLTAPGRWPARWSGTGRTSRSCEPSGGAASSGTASGVRRNAAWFCSTMRARLGGFGAETPADSAMNAPTSERREHRVEAPLEADRRRRPRAHRRAAERARDMPGEHLDPVRQLEEPPQRVEEALRALGRADREVGAGRVSDEERVAGEHEPRLVRPRPCRSRRGSSAPAGGRACGCTGGRRSRPRSRRRPPSDRAGTRRRPPRGWSPGRRDRARGGRAQRRGRRACGSRSCARSGRRGARPRRGSARSRGADRRRRPPRPPRSRRGTRRIPGRRSGSGRRARARP